MSNGLDRLVRDRRLNAWVGWGIVAVVAVVAVGEAATGDLLWSVFAAGAAAVAVVPAVAFRDPEVMPPWEVLAVAALPVLGRAVATLPTTGALSTYLAVAAVALVVAVELDAFTPVRMTIGFAILFVVVTTMATAATWALLRGAADWWLGSAMVGSEEALMWEFVYSTVAGVGGGLLFEAYFRRRARVDERIPDGIRREIESEGPGTAGGPVGEEGRR